MSSHGGALVGPVDLDLALRGTANQTVDIVGINVVPNCKAPLTGTLFYSQGQGTNQNVSMGIDLDNQYPYVQDYTEDGTLTGNWFAEHTLSLAPGERQVLAVELQTSSRYCTFTLQLQVDNGASQIEEPVSDNGHPFAITATSLASPPHMFTHYSALYVGGFRKPPSPYAWLEENPLTAAPREPYGDIYS